MKPFGETVEGAGEAQEQEQTVAEVRHSDGPKQRVAALLSSKLVAFHAHLDNLKQDIEAHSPRLEADYEVRGVGTLRGLQPSRYSLTADDAFAMTRFAFKCYYESHASIRTETGDRTVLERLREYLEKHRLKFKIASLPNGRNQVTVDGSVVMSIEFSADPDNEVICLELRNVESLGSESYQLDPSKLDQSFIGEIARCILHKPNDLAALTGKEFDEMSRLRFKDAIAQAKQLREAQLEKAEFSGESTEAEPRGETPRPSRWRRLGWLTKQGAAI